MKRIYTTPLWMSLAVAVSPIVRANETPKESQPAAPAAADLAVPTDALAGLQKQFENMNRAIKAARHETADVTGQRDAAREEAEAVREAKHQLETQLADLKKQLEVSNHEVWQWKDKAAVLEKKLGAGEEAFRKLAGFRDEMDTALKEFAVLKRGLAEVRGELQAPAERVALKKELAEANAAKEQLAKKLGDEAKAHAESKRQLVASESFAKELKKAFEELKANAKSQLEALAKAKQELGGAREQLAAVSKENTGLKESKATVEKELQEARKELGATRDTLAMLQKESAQLRSTLQPLSAEIQAAKDQTAKASAAIQEASAARDKAEQGRVEMEARLKEVSSQLANALATQNGLKEQVASKTSEIENLRKKVEEMEAKTANQPPPEEEGRESASR